MTMNKSLSAQKREGTGKGVARKMRQAGRVPAVVYGKDMESEHVSLDAREALHLFETISVDNTIVEIQIEGGSAHPTLVREIQSHPVRRELIHVDFLRIQEGVKVDVDIPVHLEGTPVGVKQHGGVLDHVIHELPVRCIPSNIPDSFIVDVSELDINDSIHVSDLALGEGVEVTIDLDRTVCSVSVPKTPTLDAEDAEAAAEAALEAELVGEEGEGEGEEGAEESGEDDEGGED